MKYNLLFLLLLGFLPHVYPQQPTRTNIERSGNYYYGASIAADENRARDEALSAISAMIAVTVAGSFEMTASEKDLQYTETATSIIKTYSTATLRNVETIRSVMPDGRIEIFGYILKSKVNEIYDQRKKLVHSLYVEGRKNEQSGNLAFALKQWYFAGVLLKSIPEQNIVVEGANLTVGLPSAINQALHKVRFEVAAERQVAQGIREIEFRVTYNGHPVSLLHYRFWDGRENNGTGQVRDGLSTIRLAGSGIAFDRITIYPQYEYYTARTENKTVEELWDLVKRPEYSNAINVPIEAAPTPAVEPEALQKPIISLSLKFDEEVIVAEQIMENANQLLQLIAAGDHHAAKRHYRNDQFLADKLSDYMRHNSPQMTGAIQQADINATASGFEVRKISMLHTYPGINRQATEYLVLDFDENGKPVDLNLCITDDLYEKFVEQADFARDWEQRQQIIKFVEKYRTAFHTRDMATINLMFAEEALILIGRRIETRPVNPNEVVYNSLPGQPDFEQIQLSKQQYLTRQKQIFDHQQDIFIDFSTFDINAKSNAPDVYGVMMRQHYSSTTYADEGYLFLLIDFHKKDPLIYIRAWQPNEWDSSALVNTANFRVFK
jgi:hypothetical protein